MRHGSRFSHFFSGSGRAVLGSDNASLRDMLMPCGKILVVLMSKSVACQKPEVVVIVKMFALQVERVKRNGTNCASDYLNFLQGICC